jgi:hypothetical protein
MKFSGPVQLLTSDFWVGVLDQQASRVALAKKCLFLENLSPPRVFVILGRDTLLFGNLRTRAKNFRERNFKFKGCVIDANHN